MKQLKPFLLICTMLMATISMVFAQTKTFNYQAALRGSTGTVLANQSVTVAFSIRQGGASGPEAYGENHTVTTNDQGLVNLTIGGGTASNGVFADIEWIFGPYFLNVKVNGVDLGTSEFKSVPYANFTSKAGVANNGAAGFSVDSSMSIVNIGQAYEIKTTLDGKLQFVANGAGGTPAMTLDDDNNQNVGIGTATPSEKLEVNGAIKVTGTTTNPQPRTLYGNALPIAYGFVYYDGTLSNSFGVASVTKTATGRYNIVLSNPVSGGANFNATMWDTNAIGFISYYQQNSTLINVRTTGTTGADQNQGFSFVVFGTAQ